MRASKADRQSDVDAIVCLLAAAAPEESVRTIEVLANVMARTLAETRSSGLAEEHARTASAWKPPLCGERLSMFRRIASRAASGCLDDKTSGANAFHRIGEQPQWSAGLLPSAEAGPFLFYRR